MTRFAGRESELAVLGAELERHGRVTVIGLPGIGKSRLIRELGRRLASAGSVLEVDADTAGLGLLATALSGPEAERPSLFVVDGAERASGELRQLLAGAGDNPRWLLSSRVPLRFAGEALFELRGLSLGDGDGCSEALRLFEACAAGSVPGFALNPENRAVLSALVAALDGHPLAIEFAAARLRSTSPGQLLDNAGRMLDWLSEFGEGARRPLRAVYADACSGLLPWQAEALAQSGVFAGSFSLQSAEAVLDLSAHVEAPWMLDVLGTLRDCSLLEVESAPGSEPRFRLPSTLRAFACERLAQLPVAARVRERHARHYVELGERWIESAQAGDRQALSLLQAERLNLSDAQSHAAQAAQAGSTAAAALSLSAAVVLGRVALMVGPVAEGVKALDRALELGQHDELRAAQALGIRGDLLRLLSRLAEAKSDYRQALAVAESRGDSRLAARLLRPLGVALLRSGDQAASRQSFERSLELARKAGDRQLEGRVLSELAYVEMAEGRLDVAHSTLERAMALHRAYRDERWAAIALFKLAMIATEHRRLEEARFLCERALGTARALGDTRFEAEYLFQLAHVERDLGRPETALAHFDAALARFRELGYRGYDALVAADRGALLSELGRGAEARAAFEQALIILRDAELPLFEACVLGRLGALEADAGHTELGRALLDQADERSHASPDAEPAAAALSLYRARLELALSREAAQSADTALADQHRERAEQALSAHDQRAAGVTPMSGALNFWHVSEIRVAERGLLAELGRAERPSGAVVPPMVLLASPNQYVMASDGRWFRTPGGKLVSVESRPTLHSILKLFVERRVTHPGQPTPVRDVFELVWVGQRIDPNSARSRVYSSLWLLRDLGLRDVIVKREGGYMLAPELTVVQS